MRQSIILSLALAVVLTASSCLAEDKQPLKVFLLVGQSNMEGKGQSGHINALLANPDTPAEERAKFEGLIDENGEHVVRDDVWIWYLGQTGNLQPGFANAPEKNGKPFGPELGFGHVIGNHYDEQVLLIKCAWGGKSLKRDFRPPSHPPTQAELDEALEKALKKDPNATMETVRDSYGFYYRETIRMTKDVLASLEELFPGHDDEQGYEIVGMVWFQGWNDLVGEGNPEYGEQLACLIRDMRKDLEAPDMKVVIGESGHGGPIEEDQKGSGKDIVRQGQAAPAKMPEFQGNVAFCQTHQFHDPSLPEYVALYNKVSGDMRRALSQLAKERGVDKIPKDEIPQELTDEVWAPWNAVRDDWIDVGGDKGYHFFGSGRIFYLMGDAFGNAMIEMEP